MMFFLHLFLLLFAILPINLMATTFCEQELALPKIDPQLEKATNEIGRHSCSDEELMSAFCKTSQVPSLKSMKNFINSQKSSKLENENINGVQLEGESEVLLDAFRELSTPLHHLGLGISTLKKKTSLQKDYNINPDCKSVECAMTKIWGEKMGTQILYIYLAHGFNSSEHSYLHSTRFTEEEMEDVLLALGDLPTQYKKIGWHPNERGIKKERLERASMERPKGQRLSRFTATGLGGNKQIADATISLLELWTTQSRAKRQYTIYHEISHNIATHLHGLDLSEEWLKLSGWKKTSEEALFDPNETWKKNEDACFVSGYASEKPQEDFAESLTAYRYVSARFKEECPAKYKFIKEKVYNNQEYLSSSHCEKN